MTQNVPAHAYESHKGQQRYKLPPTSRQILLIRHASSVGETVDTVQLGALTISNPVLSAEGEEQALLLAEALKIEPIAHVFVSPLQRTHQTAAPYLAATGMQAAIIDDLREVYLGDWEHSFYTHARAGHPLVKEMFAQESWSVIPNAETMEEFGDRVRRGVSQIVAMTQPGETSAAFTHAATIGEICRQATRSRPFAFTPPENCSVTRLLVDADGLWKLRTFNDVAHLGYH